MNPTTSSPGHAGPLLPVLIAGGGPVGLTLAALLAKQGVRCEVIEADEGYCTGSRAICMSRRSQEILGWVDADEALVRKGLSWVGGRSHFRDREVLHFRMPSEPSERFAPMVNIQQFHVERIVHEAVDRHPGLCSVHWSSRVVDVRPGTNLVEVDIEDAQGRLTTRQAAYLVACDGGRSTVRERMGLQLDGMQYEGRYVIVDIEQETRREVERLAWFDPPSNPGSTLLMHRQPDNVWRIDYQLRDDEDPDEAVRPENVLPRVRSHLEMIGETAPWRLLWVSIYSAKCLTLPSYRHGRVLFAGDAAHMVPIFGVRGLNSGLDDAGNLAWKLARVLNGHSSDELLDSYSFERVLATRENLAYGAKSTEFMAPPHFGFRLMREAALRLALEDEQVRPLVNPRQTEPVNYVGSPLNLPGRDTAMSPLAAPGCPAPEALLGQGVTQRHLTRRFGRDFVVLHFTAQGAGLGDAAHAALGGLEVIDITPRGASAPDAWEDLHGQAWDRYDASHGTVYVIRPDGYVLARWHAPAATMLATALAPWLADAA